MSVSSSSSSPDSAASYTPGSSSSSSASSSVTALPTAPRRGSARTNPYVLDSDEELNSDRDLASSVSVSASVISTGLSYASVAASPPRCSPSSGGSFRCSPSSGATALPRTPISSGRRGGLSVSPLPQTRQHRGGSTDEEVVRRRGKHPRRMPLSYDDDDDEIVPG